MAGVHRAHVLDSYAVLAWLQGEEASVAVTDLFELARSGRVTLSMCVINLGEVLYIIEREDSIQAAQRALAMVDGLPLTQVSVERDLALQAAHYKAVYRMSYADCFSLALAKASNAVLVTGDPEFRMQTEVDLLWVGD